jgi:hypothetical protein
MFVASGNNNRLVSNKKRNKLLIKCKIKKLASHKIQLASCCLPHLFRNIKNGIGQHELMGGIGQ